MGIDRTHDGEANAEDKPDRPPPPPPDRPGTDGYPSRADSRRAAAAANEVGPQTTDDMCAEKSAGIYSPQQVSIESASVKDKSERSVTSESSDSDIGSVNQHEKLAPGTETGSRPAAETGSATAGASSQERVPEVGTTRRDKWPAARERDRADRLTVAGRPLREHLDPAGAAAWSNEIGDEAPDPSDRTGDRIANRENEERSRAENLRRKFHREGTEAAQTTGKVASRVKDLLSRSPTGHSESTAGPSLSSAPHEGISVGDTATALIAMGVMLGELGRRIHGTLGARKGHHDGRHV